VSLQFITNAPVHLHCRDREVGRAVSLKARLPKVGGSTTSAAKVADQELCYRSGSPNPLKAMVVL